MNISTSVNTLSEIRQPAGTPIINPANLTLQGVSAFEDHGDENAAINTYMDNAAGVIPTWLDYEIYVGRDAANTAIAEITAFDTKAIADGNKYKLLMPYGSVNVLTDDIIVKTADAEAKAEIAENGKNAWIITVTAKNGTDTEDYVLEVEYDGYYETAGIYTEKDKYEVAVGESIKINIIFSPENATDKTLVWSSSDEKIAKVEDGIVTAIRNGTAVIKAVSVNGHETECEITVTTAAKSIKLNKTKVRLEPNDIVQLSALVTPQDTTEMVLWSSSNRDIAKVSSAGLVTALRVGTVVITAETSSGLSAECSITVANEVVPVTGVAIDDENVVMAVGDAKHLSGRCIPENAEDAELTWSSSDENVCIVSKNGVVTAMSGGIAVISAVSSNGCVDRCTVKVVSAEDTSILLSGTGISPGEEAHVKAQIVKNPGISAYKLVIGYDKSSLTPVAITPNSEAGGNFTSNIDDNPDGELIVVWNSASDFTDNTELFDITFRADDLVQYNDTTAVTIECGNEDICNAAGELVAVYTEGADISISDPALGDIFEDSNINVYDLNLETRCVANLTELDGRQQRAADVTDDGEIDIKDVVALAQYISGDEDAIVSLFEDYSESGSVSVRVGNSTHDENGDIVIPVCIDGNTGIAGFAFELEYDSEKLNITEIVKGDVTAEGELLTNLGQEEGSALTVEWHNTANVQENGTVFIIKARWTDDTAGLAVPISITEKENNICNAYRQNVQAEYISGSAISGKCAVAVENGELALYSPDDTEGINVTVIAAEYDENSCMTKCEAKEITLSAGRQIVGTNISDVENSKIFIWDSLSGMRPIN